MELPPVSKPQGELAALLDPQPGQMLTCPPGFTRCCCPLFKYVSYQAVETISTFSGLDLGPSLEDQPLTSKVNLASVLSPSDDVLALFYEEKVWLSLKISDGILIKLTG